MFTKKNLNAAAFGLLTDDLITRLDVCSEISFLRCVSAFIEKNKL